MDNKVLRELKIIPVIAIEDAALAPQMAKALIAGGLPAAEITFRTSAAAHAIEEIANIYPDMFLCAGTILTVEQAKLAVACGAKAIISPGTNIKVVEWCQNNCVPVFPGCVTPTEIEKALEMGLNTVKFFPAEAAGGIKMLKALYGPYSGVSFMPTGGISAGNVCEYLALPNVIACGGSWICSPELLGAGDFETIEKNAAQCVSLVKNL